jgi:signal transduction histidine kinase
MDRVEDVIVRIGDKIGTHFRASVCLFGQVGGNNVSPAYEWRGADNISPGEIQWFNDYISSKWSSANSCAVIIAPDAHGNEDPGSVFQAQGIGSFIVVPFSWGGKCRYYLAMLDAKSREWRTDELNLIKEIAGRISARLERVKAEETLRESEEQKAYLLKLTDTLRQIHDPLLIQEEAMRAVGEYLGVDGALYAEFLPESMEFMVAVNYVRTGLSPQVGRFKAGEIAGLVPPFDNGLTRVIRSVASTTLLTDAEKGMAAKAGIQALVAVPVLKKGSSSAQFIVQQGSARDWSPDELELLRETAERTSTAIERAKAAEALRLSEKRLRELNESLERRVLERSQEIIDLKVRQDKEKLNAVIYIQEQERARIAEGLHNGVAQLLYAAQSRLHSIENADEKLVSLLREVDEILVDAVSDIRKISFELMPPILRDYGLKSSIASLVQRVAGDRLCFQLDVKLNQRLNEELEVSIYRFVQEILNNILKHSEATNASLSLYVKDRQFHLIAADNGKGFRLKNRQNGIGLRSMRNRVKLLDGEITINSKARQGTNIHITVPLRAKV